MLNLCYFVTHDVPNISTHSGISHLSQQLHVIGYLMFVFLVYLSKLEVNDNGVVTICHYSVWTELGRQTAARCL